MREPENELLLAATSAIAVAMIALVIITLGIGETV